MASLADILNNQGETLVCHNHLQQQITFALGSGIEFLPRRDEADQRKVFIEGIVKTSRLPLKLKGMLVRMIKHGRLLLYLRPVGRTYKIESYKQDQYKLYQNSAGDIESVKIIYSYKREINGQVTPRWVCLRITAELVEVTEHDAKPDFNREYQPSDFPDAADFRAEANPLGVIPVREVLNPAPASEELGSSDFEALGSRIEAHDEMTSSILDNLSFCCTNPILTSRNANEVSEQVFGQSDAPERDSVAYASGFRDSPGGSPGGSLAGSVGNRRRRKLKRVIGGVEDDERFQVLEVDPVSADLANFADGYERQLRESMGGILERGIETATESRVVYGKVAATAAEKQVALYTYGLCELLELAVFCEENLFAASGGTIGLPELGDRSVYWRMGSVYQETPESINYRSITGRNLAKFFGVSPKAAIKYVFPDKSENEIDAMVGDGGFPSDYLQTAIAMFGQLSQTIDPMTGLPVADETGVPLAYKLLPFITNNLDYGQQFNPVDESTPIPADAAVRAFLAALNTVRGQSVNGVGELGAAATGQNVQQLPSPGATVATRANTGFWGTNFPTFTAIADSIRGTFNRT